MRGTVNLNCPSYLPTLFGSTPEGVSLLAIVYGHTEPEPVTPEPAQAAEDVLAGRTTTWLRSEAERPMQLVV